MASIGSVSQGTLKTEDLLPDFLDALCMECVEGNPAHWALVNRVSVSLENEDLTWEDWIASGEAEDALEELQEALGEYAPPYCYFGTLTGDPTNFGFWVDPSLAEDFDGPVVDYSWRGRKDPIPDDYQGYWLHVSDHGNLTLFERDAKGDNKEIWGIV